MIELRLFFGLSIIQDPIEKALTEKGSEKENNIEKAKTSHNHIEKALPTSKPLQAVESEMLVRPRKYDEKPLQESRIRKTL